MKKLLIVIGAVLLLSVGISPVFAIDARPYFDVHGGATITDNATIGGSSIKYDPGFVAGGAFGLDFEMLRLEANVDYRRSSFSNVNPNGTLQLLSYMVNGHLVAPIKFPVKPYLLGGLGFATAYVDGGAIKENDTKFAYEIGAGIGYEIKRNVTLDFNYRYLGASDFDMSGSEMGYFSNNFLFGVRYSY